MHGLGTGDMLEEWHLVAMQMYSNKYIYTHLNFDICVYLLKEHKNHYKNICVYIYIEYNHGLCVVLSARTRKNMLHGTTCSRRCRGSNRKEACGACSEARCS